MTKPRFQATTKGLVIVYTGEGKGKTTAALGLVLRAVGYKKKILIVQFGKIWFTGELEAVKKLKPFVKLVQGGLGFVGIYDDQASSADHKAAVQKTFEMLYQEVASKKWDIVVADEIIGAVAGEMLDFEQLKQLIQTKPEKLDLVLTGHHASKELIDLSDLATEMIALKHPYEKGLLAKEAIDY